MPKEDGQSRPLTGQADQGLSRGELASEGADVLPDREAMSLLLVPDNFAMPINEATAINYQSSYSIASADADQIVIVDQTDVDPEPTTDTTPGNSTKGGRNG